MVSRAVFQLPFGRGGPKGVPEAGGGDALGSPTRAPCKEAPEDPAPGRSPGGPEPVPFEGRGLGWGGEVGRAGSGAARASSRPTGHRSPRPGGAGAVEPRGGEGQSLADNPLPSRTPDSPNWKPRAAYYLEWFLSALKALLGRDADILLSLFGLCTFPGAPRQSRAHFPV